MIPLTFAKPVILGKLWIIVQLVWKRLGWFVYFKNCKFTKRMWHKNSERIKSRPLTCYERKREIHNTLLWRGRVWHLEAIHLGSLKNNFSCKFCTARVILDLKTGVVIFWKPNFFFFFRFFMFSIFLCLPWLGSLAWMWRKIRDCFWVW